MKPIDLDPLQKDRVIYCHFWRWVPINWEDMGRRGVKFENCFVWSWPQQPPHLLWLMNSLAIFIFYYLIHGHQVRITVSPPLHCGSDKSAPQSIIRELKSGAPHAISTSSCKSGPDSVNDGRVMGWISGLGRQSSSRNRVEMLKIMLMGIICERFVKA